MEKKIKRPDKFKIKIENNNGKEIIDFLVKKGYINYYNLRNDLGDGNYYSNKNNRITTFSSSSDYKEYTLEEFKKLFEPQFEVGKWYKSNIGSMNGKFFYYLKVINIISNCHLEGERIKSSGDYEKDSYWDHKHTLKQALELGPLTDLSEIQQYLPDGHPDKISTIPKYVELLNTGCAIDDNIYKGNIYKLTKDSRGHYPLEYLLDDKYKIGMYEDQYSKYLKLSTKEAYDNQNNKNMFKKDDYIVVLRDQSKDSSYIKFNYCFKQGKDSKGFFVEKDLEGGITNCGLNITFNKKDTWRYATKEEIAEYDRLGKPFDVTTLNTKKYDYEVVHCTTQKEWDFVQKKLGYDYEGLKYSKNTECINLNSKYYLQTLEYFQNFKNNEVKIYSFQEWCDKFNHKPDFNKSLVGRYLKILEDNAYGTNFKLGEYVKIIKEDKQCNYVYVERNNYSFISSNFKGCNVELMPEGFIPEKELKELTELPKKWCFTTTKESNDIFHKWYNRQNDKTIGNHYCSDNGIVKGWMYYAPERKKGYTEITFDQFKKWVLKENDMTEEKWIPKVGDYIYANANIKSYGPQVTKIDRIHWESNEYFHCVCKFKHLDGTLHPCLNTNWNHQVDNISNFLRPATKEEIYNYEKEQLLLKGEPVIQEMEFEWHVTEFNETKKSYEQVELNQKLREYPLTPKESYNTKKLPTKSWY